MTDTDTPTVLSRRGHNAVDAYVAMLNAERALHLARAEHKRAVDLMPHEDSRLYYAATQRARDEAFADEHPEQAPPPAAATVPPAGASAPPQ